MKDYDRIFNPERSGVPEERLVEGAMKCLDNFGDQFNAENPDGMDDFLHFPHYLLSGNTVIEWKERGQLPSDFFTDLKKQGWQRTATLSRKVVLVSPDKVHVRVTYTRERADGTIISEHENLWILIFRDKKWGIVLRSY